VITFWVNGYRFRACAECVKAYRDRILKPYGPDAIVRPDWYVGLCGAAARQTFRSSTRPTAGSHPEYLAVIGPFRTRRGAMFAAAHPWSSAVSVSAYEYAAHAARETEVAS
jgi:hypothetical protein